MDSSHGSVKWVIETLAVSRQEISSPTISVGENPPPLGKPWPGGRCLEAVVPRPKVPDLVLRKIGGKTTSLGGLEMIYKTIKFSPPPKKKINEPKLPVKFSQFFSKKEVIV